MEIHSSYNLKEVSHHQQRAVGHSSGQENRRWYEKIFYLSDNLNSAIFKLGCFHIKDESNSYQTFTLNICPNFTTKIVDLIFYFHAKKTNRD
jgi:hypothetical protein